MRSSSVHMVAGAGLALLMQFAGPLIGLCVAAAIPGDAGGVVAGVMIAVALVVSLACWLNVAHRSAYRPAARCGALDDHPRRAVVSRPPYEQIRMQITTMARHRRARRRDEVADDPTAREGPRRRRRNGRTRVPRARDGSRHRDERPARVVRRRPGPARAPAFGERAPRRGARLRGAGPPTGGRSGSSAGRRTGGARGPPVPGAVAGHDVVRDPDVSDPNFDASSVRDLTPSLR